MTLPMGSAPLGKDDWGAGIVLPVSFDPPSGAGPGITGTAGSLPDNDGDGRHLSLAALVGLGVEPGESELAVAELSVQRDPDPSGHRTLALATGSVAWQPAKTWQLDLLAAAGLRHTPDFRLVIGGALLFQ